jgi:hypothetical protein
VLRWLLPLIAAIAVLGSAVTTWAAAGYIGQVECCCPDKSKCKCHEHDGKPVPHDVMKKCGGGTKWVAPAVTPAVPEPATVVTIDVRITKVTTSEIAPVPTSHTIEPETPPF